MKYKLIGNNDTNDVIKTILVNRGVVNPEEYINLSEKNICYWQDLKNINEAVECFAEHFERRDDIAVLVDCDP